MPFLLITKKGFNMKTITQPFTEVEFKEVFAGKASVDSLSEDAVKEVLEYINGLNFEEASFIMERY